MCAILNKVTNTLFLQIDQIRYHEHVISETGYVKELAEQHLYVSGYDLVSAQQY